jgi:17beta-estradiol 17-dehydrogenase / very-long-chain 3-oxoacyl-CoA reductase
MATHHEDSSLHLVDDNEYHHSTLSSAICFYVGLFTTLYYLTQIGLFIWKHKLVLTSPYLVTQQPEQAKKFFAKTYGANSFAVVTGGSEGVGRQFCLQLAQLGFRIIVIARSVSKLEKVCEEIQHVSSSPSKKSAFYISFDFSKANDAEYETLFKQIDQIIGDDHQPEQEGQQENSSNRVSFLINNVGIHYEHLQYFIEHSTEDDCRLLKVNCESQIRMTHHFYNQKYFLKNNNSQQNFRHAIIDLASISGYCPIPLGAVYAGTKAFNGHFNKSLALEHEGKQIDFVSVWPGFIATAMTHSDKADWQRSSVESVVDGVLKQLVFLDGNKNKNNLGTSTPGSPAHFPLAGILQIVPNFALEWFVLRQNKECREKGWIAPMSEDRKKEEKTPLIVSAESK